MYLMKPLVGDVRKHVNAAIKALARIPMTDAVKDALEEAETEIDKAQGRLSVLERECAAKEPATV